MTSGSVYFTELNRQELVSRLKSLVNNKLELLTWIKGRAAKEYYNPLSLNIEQNKLKVTPVSSFNFVGKDILYKFQIAGSHYFGIGKIVKEAKTGDFYLEFEVKLYKSERRASYRLITYPHHDARVHFKVDDNYDGNNVVDIKTGLTQTGIFKSFLKLIGQRNEFDQNNLAQRVLDISVTGLSFIVGEAEKSLFKKNQLLESFTISFNGDEFMIPSATIVYVVDYFQYEKKGIKQYKVGVQFNDLSTNIDTQLGKKINQILRENESNDDFEQLLKED